MLPVTFCGSPGWGSLEPQPTDWPGAGARVWFPDPALALPGWDCPLWPASCISDCYSMLTWPGGPTRQQILLVIAVNVTLGTGSGGGHVLAAWFSVVFATKG